MRRCARGAALPPRARRLPRDGHRCRARRGHEAVGGPRRRRGRGDRERARRRARAPRAPRRIPRRVAGGADRAGGGAARRGQPAAAAARRDLRAPAHRARGAGAARVLLRARCPASIRRRGRRCASTSEPELGLPHYLAGLQHAAHDDQQAACAEELDRGLTLGVPDPMFVENGARRLAVVCSTTGEGHLRACRRRSPGSPASHPSPIVCSPPDWSQRLAFDRR